MKSVFCFSLSLVVLITHCPKVSCNDTWILQSLIHIYFGKNDLLMYLLKVFTLMGFLLSLLFFVLSILAGHSRWPGFYTFVDYDKLVPRCFTRLLTVQSHWAGFYMFVNSNKYLLRWFYGRWLYIANDLVSIYSFIMINPIPGVLLGLWQYVITWFLCFSIIIKSFSAVFMNFGSTWPITWFLYICSLW